MIASASLTVVLMAALSLAGSPAAAQANADAPKDAQAPRSRDAIYEVGETAPADADIADSYPGLDLPPLEKTEGYLRSNEHIYRVDRTSREILEVVEVSTVLLM